MLSLPEQFLNFPLLVMTFCRPPASWLIKCLSTWNASRLVLSSHNKTRVVYLEQVYYKNNAVCALGYPLEPCFLANVLFAMLAHYTASVMQVAS